MKDEEISNTTYRANAHEIETLVTQFHSALKEKKNVLEEKEKRIRV